MLDEKPRLGPRLFSLIRSSASHFPVKKSSLTPIHFITQSSAISKKGILVATIGDLTGLLSGPYENIYYYINDHLGTPQILRWSSKNGHLFKRPFLKATYARTPWDSDIQDKNDAVYYYRTSRCIQRCLSWLRSWYCNL